MTYTVSHNLIAKLRSRNVQRLSELNSIATNLNLTTIFLAALQKNRKGANGAEKKTTSRNEEEFLKCLTRPRHSFDPKEQCWSKVIISLVENTHICKCSCEVASFS